MDDHSDDRGAAAPNADAPLAAVAVVVGEAGLRGRRVRELLARMSQEPTSFDDLIRHSALPRRSVEQLLRAIATDVIEDRHGLAIRPDRVPVYRDRFQYDQLARTQLDDAVGRQLSQRSQLLAQIRTDIADGPRSRAAFDHVSATPTTVGRRALWLDATFDLAGRRLLCLGDHDLTSLALCAVNPAVEVTVADIDERVLEYLDTLARKRGLSIRCLYGDFRLGLPEAAVAAADLVLTDPPYTPEGIQLFSARGLQGLRDRDNGRLILAYGFSERAPALGVKVQRAILDLELAIEAILPKFNRYHGAQAVGSASDLYVCQPTAHTWKVLDRRLDQIAVRIYTHGEQSLEATRRPACATETHVVHTIATGGSEAPVITVNGQPDDPHNTPLHQLLASGFPAQWVSTRPVMVTADLSADPGPWLLRCLLAANADRLAVLVPNKHPDLASETGQQELSALVAAKYSLTFRRSVPNRWSAVVEAVAVDPDGLQPSLRLVRHLLDRARGKLDNVWRDGLLRSSRAHNQAMTKNEARALISAVVRQPQWLESRLIDLPRHQLAALLADVTASAAGVL